MKKSFTFLIILFLLGCEEKNDLELVKGYVQVSFSNSIPKNSRMTGGTTPKGLIMTIKNASGELIYNVEEFPLFKIGDGYYTKSLELEADTYFVEEFLVTDEADSVIYLTPKVGSKLESLVDHSLPFSFTVSATETNTVSLQVIEAGLGSASQFGYSTFTFEIVKGLVAYYPFLGSANDYSANNADGILLGPVLTYDKENNQSAAYYFNGDDYIVNSSDSTFDITRDLTLEAFIKPDSITDHRMIMSKHCSWYSRSYDLMIDHSKFRFAVFDKYNNEYILYGSTPKVNEWYHVKGVYDYALGTMFLYIDGFEVASKDIGQINIMNSEVPFTIGAYWSKDSGSCASTRGFFQGVIDEVKVWNVAKK